MKKYLLITLMLLGLLVFATSGYCVRCSFKPCKFSAQCSTQCWCSIGQFASYGKCVPVLPPWD